MDYVNLPTVVVILIPYRGNIIVERRAQGHGAGLLALPAGYQDGKIKEHIRIAAAREVREELGLELDPTCLRVIEATTDQYGTNLTFFIYTGPEFQEMDYITDKCVLQGDEVTEVLVFTPMMLNDERYKIAFPLHEQIIERYFNGIYG